MKKLIFLPITIFAALFIIQPFNANATPILRNDYDQGFEELDANVSHYEYKEKLERGEIEQELAFEVSEVGDVNVELIENEIEEDHNPRTNFFSSKKRNNNIFGGENSFSYYHQLPPNVNPDVDSSPYFNEFDFSHDLIEFEFTVGGRSSTNSSIYEAFIQEDGVNIASLGELSLDEYDHGYFKFELDFTQYGAGVGGLGISDEIYSALSDSDGWLDINIVRTSGVGDFYITHSVLALEQPSEVAPVPEPSTVFLLTIGLFGLYVRKIASDQ